MCTSTRIPDGDEADRGEGDDVFCTLTRRFTGVEILQIIRRDQIIVATVATRHRMVATAE
jgi:hypothetical protein